MVRIFFVLILMFLSLITACSRDDVIHNAESPGNLQETNGTEPVRSLVARNAAESIEYYVLTLASEEFAGRMAGTRGNDLAVEWLIERLQGFGIAPYSEGGFKIGFTGWSNTFARSEMIIAEADGTARKLEQGRDFFISLGEGSFTVALERGSDSYMVLTHDAERGARIQDASAEYFVYFSNNGFFRNAAGSFSRAGSFWDKTIQLSDETYEIIRNGGFDQIGINNVVNYEQKELYHVTGRISGSNPANCVVISAHFDGMGQGGSAHFPGALDNASGTAALLYIAERLKTISETQPFDFDIVIAFFNSEEHFDNGRPLGSRFFVPVVMDDYENVWNINIDCVGSRGGEVYHTGGSGSSALREAVAAFAEGRGIYVDSSIAAMSDNVNFTDMGIPSFNFLSDGFMVTGVAHTNMDTPDRLYYPQIVRLSDMIVDFLLQSGISVFEADELSGAPLLGSAGEQADATMVERFERVFDALQAGERVSFYEDFYRHFPEEEQRFFSFYEAAEIYEGLSAIRDFGVFRLAILGTNQTFDKPGLIYFHALDPDELGLRIQPLNPVEIEMVAVDWQYQVTDTPGLAGYSALFLPESNSFGGFIYEGGVSFLVSPSRFSVLSNFGSHALTIIGTPARISEIDVFADFIRSLQFDEFLENWKGYHFQ